MHCSSSPSGNQIEKRHFCHPTNPVECDTCLQLVAETLAREFGSRQAAMLAPIVWYRAQLGEDVCRLSRAAKLKMWTVDQCSQAQAKLYVVPRPAGDAGAEDVGTEKTWWARGWRCLLGR